MKKFSRSQLELLIWFCSVYLSWGLTDSIQAPFYPVEAEKKGANSGEYGLVFGIIHLAMFISSPLFGHYMDKFGMKGVLVFGIIGTGVCSCLFGLLTYIPGKWPFLSASYILRTFEGIAEAGAWSSAITLLSMEYKEHVTMVYSLTQASFGFAEILGPSLGGIMFEAQGFALPFEFSGVLCLLVGTLTLVRLPRITNYTFSETNTSTEAEEKNASVKQITRMLKNKVLLASLVGTMFSAACQGFVESFLEEYLALFGLSVAQIGASFLAMSIPYMICSPIWGYLTDNHWLQPEIISPIGNGLIILSFFLIGPVKYLHYHPNYPLTESGLVCLGIGTAATVTATFAICIKQATDTFQSDGSSSMISGVWTAAFAFGNFLGPTVGGPLVDWLGFSGTTPILQVWALVMLFIDGLILTFSKSTKLVNRGTHGSNVHIYSSIE